MLKCEEYSNILGEKRIRITISGEDRNRLQETGLWDKGVEALVDEPEGGEE